MWVTKGDIEIGYKKEVVEAWTKYEFDLSTCIKFGILHAEDTLTVTLKITDRYGDNVTFQGQ